MLTFLQLEMLYMCMSDLKAEPVKGELFMLFSVRTLLMTFYYCWHLYVPLWVTFMISAKKTLRNCRF